MTATETTLPRCKVRGCPQRWNDDDGDRLCRDHADNAPITHDQRLAMIRELMAPRGQMTTARQARGSIEPAQGALK
jgi:hypothetical protein